MSNNHGCLCDASEQITQKADNHIFPSSFYCLNQAGYVLENRAAKAYAASSRIDVQPALLKFVIRINTLSLKFPNVDQDHQTSVLVLAIFL